MSKREQLNAYIRQVQQRLRFGASVRGAALIACVALLTTILLTLLLNAYAFPEHAITPARISLLLVLVVATGAGLAWPLLRLNRKRSIDRAESGFPEFQQRLLTFAERDSSLQQDPFLELLAADTLSVAVDARPSALAPVGVLAGLFALLAISIGVLGWMISSRPGYLGYGASLLWTGPHHEVAPLYEIRVLPGDSAVRRSSDQAVTAQIVGLNPAKVILHARYQSASSWQDVAMQPQMDASGFQFLFTGLPESVEYYVEAGPVSSKHFNFRVVDLPAVKEMTVTYHYPSWTGMKTVSEDHAGDLRALEGTEAELTVSMTSPLRDGTLLLDGGQAVHLTGGEGNRYHGSIRMAKDGAYHVSATDQGQQVRLSEDYFISTSKANPPSIAIERPSADYRASPIEEVKIGVKAAADFGLNHVSLHYSVNGGAEQTVNLLKQAGAKDTDGTATLSLEDFKLSPGDVVSLYATARDAHAEARTDISFIQVEPFEREFSQSQQSGGGGGGGGGQGQNSQTDIARRQKELIAATWKQRNEKAATPQQSQATAKLLSEAQVKLREQALALTNRMQSRDLSEANEEFNSFEKDMQIAAAAMTPSADKLEHMQWQDAMPIEEKALQALLRAEATFRKIQVAFGQRGGGSGGGGGSAGRDLASLFDLEMDTEKNQYETAQTGSTAEQQAKKVDDALAKLDALAKRQEELAQQQGNQAQTFQQRWQQEMLRREAEQLQREMEQAQGQQGQQGQQGKQGGQQSASGQSGSSQGSQSSSSQSSSQRSQRDGATDPRVQQALERLRAANDDMRRAGGQQGAQQSSAEARRAAEQLRQATDLLGGAQKQQASGQLDSLGREADRLAKEEASQAERISGLAAKNQAEEIPTQAQRAASIQERNRLAEDRQRLSDDLSRLQKGLRDSARAMAPNQPATSASLRDALSAMDQTDLTNLVQRTADWLRRGVNPNANGTEREVASGLKRLGDQVRQAQQTAGIGPSGKRGQDSGTQTAALDHVDRLRNQIQSISSGRNPGPGQPGQNAQSGKGQGASQRSNPGQGQQGQGGKGSGSQGGQTQSGEAGGQGSQGGPFRQGVIGDPRDRSPQGGGGTGNYNIDTGNNRYGNSGSPAKPDVGTLHGDSERAIRQGVNELNQLRQLARDDPAAMREIQDLVREMQLLDPSRFPGNPSMVEELHTKVLNDVDKLELQLRRRTDGGQVRAAANPTVPQGYQDAVADYYRRLGKTR